MLKLEDLLNNPEVELDSLMKYIGLEISVEQKKFFLETSQETRDSTYSNFRRKEDVLDKWKSQLAPEVISDINRILEDQLQFFGYT